MQRLRTGSPTRHVRVRAASAQNPSIVTLRHLTDRVLKDIGALLGHRRIMLAAIGELVGNSPVAAKTVATGGSRKPKTPPSAAKSR